MEKTKEEEKEKKDPQEVAHLYKITIDSINAEFKQSNELLQLARKYNNEISKLKTQLEINIKKVFGKIVSAECLKNDVKEANVRTIMK